MQLYLLRHGIAEEPAPGKSDKERALTAEGVLKLRDVLAAARGAGLKPNLILTSPYRRAIETAEVAAVALEQRISPVKTQSLAPDSTPQAVWEEVRVYRDEAQLLLVGHEPLFSHAAAYLLESPTMRIDFKKGAIMRIDIEHFSAHARGILKYFLLAKLATE